MTNTYIRNATWAPTGERFDIRLAPGHNQIVPELDNLSICDAEVRPAGQMNIPANARIIDATGKLSNMRVYLFIYSLEKIPTSSRQAIWD